MDAADPSSGAARVASDVASMRRPRFVGLYNWRELGQSWSVTHEHSYDDPATVGG
jgi:hypothetical protein